MAYIYFDDLKEILPDILSDWIEPGDEGWEWIFQEIEQKCYLGKKKKDKKKWKIKIESIIKQNKVNVDSLIIKYQNLNKEVEEMHREFIDTKNNVIQLGLSMKDMGAEIKHVREDSKAAKSMAEIAKARTDVDYSKYSGKSDGRIKYSDYVMERADIVCQNIYNRMAKRGATRQELDTFKGLIHKYNALDAIIDNNPEDKDCKTCKYYCGTEAIDEPCCACDEYQCWEAKDDG